MRKNVKLITGLCMIGCCAIIGGCAGKTASEPETTVVETLSDDEIKETLEGVCSGLDIVNQLCNGVAAIVSQYWDANGFEAFVIKDDFETMDKKYNTNHNYNSGTFYGDAKLTWDAREKIDSMMEEIHTMLKEMKPSESTQGYYDAVKELYLNVDSYRSFSTGYPDGYSKMSYAQTFSEHQKEYDELVSKVNFEK